MWSDGQWMTFDDTGDLIPAPPLLYDESKAHQLFRTTLVAIRKAVKEIPGNPFTIGAISYPSHFNISCKTSLEDTAVKFETLFIEESLSWRYLTLINAARLAYGLDSCEGFGLNDTECSFLDLLPPQKIVLVEYSQNSLSFIFGEVFDAHYVHSDYYVHIDQLQSKEPLLTESDGQWQYRKVYVSDKRCLLKKPCPT
jgi:hypothetical protein